MRGVFNTWRVIRFEDSAQWRCVVLYPYVVLLLLSRGWSIGFTWTRAACPDPTWRIYGSICRSGDKYFSRQRQRVFPINPHRVSAHRESFGYRAFPSVHYTLHTVSCKIIVFNRPNHVVMRLGIVVIWYVYRIYRMLPARLCAATMTASSNSRTCGYRF